MITQPAENLIIDLITKEGWHLWNRIAQSIDEHYVMDHTWNNGGKKWVYEYKFSRSKKTLCCLYAKQDTLGFMVIYGKKERETFERVRSSFDHKIQAVYDEATTYHDGKWMMFTDLTENDLPQIISLLAIKRKPNK